MSRITRFAVLATALVSLFATLSSTAGAVTWENGGNTSFTATSGPSTLGSTGTNLGCASASATGAAPATPFTPTGSNTWSAATFTVVYSSCTFAGSPATQECSWVLTVPGVASALDPASGTVTTATGGVDVTCGYYIAGTKICHIEGQTAVSYENGVSPTKGRLNFAPSSTLRVTGANCVFGSNDALSSTAMTFNITAGSGGTGTLGPVIVRT